MASVNDGSKKGAKNTRSVDRLAAALRENLRRRKAQERGRRVASVPLTKSSHDDPDPDKGKRDKDKTA